ncbi:hypothetical protein DQ239_07315 [Blastococcus sp. TF02-09]|uniref:ester cyclase n=1 Tax=Blastococcus sp. TF02-09 TaxID=2250576 RepID=UPI000DEBC1FA|nr:ester cyclase [Blastococcus sp. TF02-9]RBY79418.1 hypothetical protein DQ239_07315 [Blastococcus sp. TF02-9]
MPSTDNAPDADVRANEEMVQDAIRVIWNDGDLDRIPESYTEDFVSHQPKEGFRWEPGRDGLRQLLTGTRKLFPDYHEHIEDCVASGDRVVLRLRNTGTLSEAMAGGPGKSFEVADFMLARVDGGKIAEQWGRFDLFGMYA